VRVSTFRVVEDDPANAQDIVAVRTSGSWLASATNAYKEALEEEEREREAERQRAQRLTGITFENEATEILGLDLRYALGGPVVGPGPFIVDDVSLRIEEHVERWRIIVGVPCGWCQRHNETLVRDQAHLGRLINAPEGQCGHCGKDLATAQRRPA
jgi:hypothetical protein